MSKLITKDVFSSGYASNPIYVFDTNIYLNLLRYSKKAGSQALALYHSIEEDIVLPDQVHKEFYKNLSKVSGERLSNANKAITTSKQTINNCSESVIKQLKFFTMYKFDKSGELLLDLESSFKDIKEKIENYKKMYLDKNNSGFLEENKLNNFVERVGERYNLKHYTPSRLLEIYSKGEVRYKYKIPPGYMDSPENNSSSDKDGVDIFGDLVLWNQIIDIAKEYRRPIFFVTADIKEDWFLMKNNKIVGPRNELYDEFLESTNGQQVFIMPEDLFIEYLGIQLDIDSSLILIEMKKSLVVSKVFKNKKIELQEVLKKWLNDNENYQLLNFSNDINYVRDIVEMDVVEDGITVNIDDTVSYNVELKGFVSVIGVYKDDMLNRVLFSERIEGIPFNINIEFVSNLEYAKSNGESVTENVANLIVKNASFQNCLTDQNDVDTSRGIFVQPLSEDIAIFNYMDSIWDKYERKYSINVAEAKVFLDASTHFNKPLLEINRSFSLVQNSNTSTMLSINEIDALGIRRFKDIGIKITGDLAGFEGESVELGELYPLPDSMKAITPESGKKLKVDFEIDYEVKKDKYISIVGKTTLPKNTNLMITLSNNEINYRAQNKVLVGEDRVFRTKNFKNGNNSDMDSLPAGNYEIDIVVPIVNVQPDEVKVIFGEKSRNLIGDNVNYDEIFGNTVRYKKSFELK